MSRFAAALAALALAACTTLAPVDRPFPGIAYHRMDPVADVPQAIHVLEVDLAHPALALEVTPGDRSGGRGFRAMTTTEYVRRHGLQAAVNGGFFEPFKGGSVGGDDYYPKSGDPVDVLGLSMHDGRVDSPPNADPKLDGTLCIRKPSKVTIERGQRCPEGTDEATTAGPLLLASGQVQSHKYSMTARHPRTAVGLSGDRRKLWLVVVDGRQPRSLGATLPDLVEIFRRLGAAEALNLDGGGSSAMVLFDGSEPRAVNSPIHGGIPGRERPAANHVGVRAGAGPARP